RVVETHRLVPGKLGDELALDAARHVRASERGGAVEMLRRDEGRRRGIGVASCLRRHRRRYSPIAFRHRSIQPEIAALRGALFPSMADLPRAAPGSCLDQCNAARSARSATAATRAIRAANSPPAMNSRRLALHADAPQRGGPPLTSGCSSF